MPKQRERESEREREREHSDNDRVILAERSGRTVQSNWNHRPNCSQQTVSSKTPKVRQAARAVSAIGKQPPPKHEIRRVGACKGKLHLSANR